MSDETDVREVNELGLAFRRQHDARLRRIAALRKSPGGARIAAELKKYPGLEPLLAALDGLGQRPDANTTTVYDRIRQQAAQKQQPTAEGPSLDERLRRR